MKTKIIRVFLLFITTLSFSQEDENTKYLHSQYEFTTGNIEYLFADKVKFRTGPTLNSTVIKLLEIGTPIKIIEKTETQMHYQGINTPWYKIEVNGKNGYILGALISLNSHFTNSKNALFLCQLKKNKEDNYIIKIRHFTKGQDYNEVELKQTGTGLFTFHLFNNKGVNNIENILMIDALAEACGVEGNITYYFWSNNKLTHIADLPNFAESGFFSTDQSFLFPNDPEGAENSIIHISKSVTYEDEESSEPKSEEIKSNSYKWTGTDFIPESSNELTLKKTLHKDTKIAVD